MVVKKKGEDQLNSRSSRAGRRGQAWGFDLMIATSIFVSGIVLIYFYSINYNPEGKDDIESLFYDGEIISDIILSEGYPRNWDTSNVLQIGIASDGKINETKLGYFKEMTDTGEEYEGTKNLFNTNHEYWASFSQTIGGIDSVGLEPTGEKNLILVKRMTVYGNEPVIMDLYMWDKEDSAA